jgi:ribonuclease HII
MMNTLTGGECTLNCPPRSLPLSSRSLEELRLEVASGPPYGETLLDALRADARAGARALLSACQRRMSREEAEQARICEMTRFEELAREAGHLRVAGVDEAGRGPLAGPLVAAAVVLRCPVRGVNDSKQLSAHQREALFLELSRGGHAIGIGMVHAPDIDAIGIQPANYRAMAQAVDQIDPLPDYLLVDGYRLPGCRLPHERLIKGDSRSLSIAAASIVAKVVRDRIMTQMHRLYPVYGFDHNKGYATADHLEALRLHGPCPAHRMSFAPLAGPAQADLFACAQGESRI